MGMGMGQVHVACKLFHYLSLPSLFAGWTNVLVKWKLFRWHGARLKSNISFFFSQLDSIESTIVWVAQLRLPHPLFAFNCHLAEQLVQFEKLSTATLFWLRVEPLKPNYNSFELPSELPTYEYVHIYICACINFVWRALVYLVSQNGSVGPGPYATFNIEYSPTTVYRVEGLSP